MTKKRHSPWVWIPALYIAEEIPTAVVTFVAVLMFLQFGASATEAAIFSGLLFVPWAMKALVRTRVRNRGKFKRNIHLAQGLMFVNLIAIALYLNGKTVSVSMLFAMLLMLSLLCAWHTLLARMYYNRMLKPRQQRIFDTTRMIASQSTLILTYGVLIIVAGTCEVFFRSYQKAWAMESYLVAGVFFVLMAVNWFAIPQSPIPTLTKGEGEEKLPLSMGHSVVGNLSSPQLGGLRGASPSPCGEGWGGVVLASFFLLLPQGLLFNSRVFFLLAPVAEGGLECSIQDVGFAQGTVGVIAFTLGIMLGKMLVARFGQKRMFAPMVASITLSPLFYMIMAHHPQPNDMLALCSMTFLAQILFGFGLGACLPFVKYVSNHPYENTFNYLYIPLVAAAMLVPMMASGWMVAMLGYRLFFIIATACAPVAWVVVGVRPPAP